MKIKNQNIQFIFPIIIGIILGYAMLHPLSVFIVFVFERKYFHLVSILTESFSPVHLWMGIYFSLIGGFIGTVFALFHYKIMKVNTAIVKINHQLKKQNEELMKKIQLKAHEFPLLGDLWITLNKVHKGVDLISSGSIGDINQRQSTLLEITQENIKDLFEIIEKSFLAEKGTTNK